MKFILMLILITIPLFQSYAQPLSILKGKVIDKNTGKPLQNSNIVVHGTIYGAAARDNGTFIIHSIPVGVYTIEVTHINYQSLVMKNVQVTRGKVKEIVLKLSPRVLEFAPIEVDADRFSMKYETEVARIGFQQIHAREMRKISGTLDDVLRSVQIFGSVMPASDYNAYFAVRGGSPEQNIVIMDGVVIPNPYRFRLLLGGGLSIFDPNTTEDVRLHIGGFSAEFGNFLSSVLEVDTREGNRHRISGKASLNLIDASGVLEGPISNGKGSWLIAGRRTYYDLLANRFSKNNETYPNTFDLNGKIVYDLNGCNKISVRSMICEESTDMLSKVDNDINVKEDSRIQLASMYWQSVASSKLTHRTTIAYYDETFSTLMNSPGNMLDGQGDQGKVYADMNSQIYNFSAREDVIYEFSESIRMTRGLYFSTMKTNVDFKMPNKVLAFARRDLPPPMQFNERETYFSFYMDDIYKLKQYIHLKVGLRYDYSDLIKKSMVNPRISLWLKLNNIFSLEGFWGMCSQNPFILSSFIRNQALDLATGCRDFEPERATHVTFGIHLELPGAIQSKLEFYNKDLDDLLFPIKKPELHAGNIGHGYSRGIEFYIKKDANERSRFSGIVSYSYGVSKYIEELNNTWLPFSFDRRHNISFMGNIKLLSNLSMNILWRASSGLPYNSAYGLMMADGFFSHKFLENDTVKSYFPSYQRLDFRLSYEHRKNNRVFSMYIDVTNVYNHHNIYDQIWQTQNIEDIQEQYWQLKMRTLYMLPLVPSLGMSVEF